MDLFILNTTFESIYILDQYESLIWTERYCDYGDFEIYLPSSQRNLSILQPGRYVKISDSEVIMIIEDIEIKFDVESGSHMIVSGRSLESILSYRIIWNRTVLGEYPDEVDLETGIEQLLNENIISPLITDRQISNFIFEASDGDYVNTLTVAAQFLGNDLGESIRNMCAIENIGFKINLVDNNFVFKLYSGIDRSYDQSDVPYVVFSQRFDNLINSKYKISNKDLKNVILIAGEGEGLDQLFVSSGDEIELVRREIYTEGSDLSQTVDGLVIDEAEYIMHLEQRGNEKLLEHISDITFDAQIDTTRMFKYGEDFFLGDIVQIVSDYGITAKARITEIIRSQNTSEIAIYPTFKIIE